MVLTALRGALGFLTRLPVGGTDSWDAFRTTPAAFPLSGYLVGGVVALPLALAAVLPAPTVAAVALAWLYAVAGVNHLDGAADLGDAAVVHGDADDRAEVLKDTHVGVGAVAALGVVLLSAALALLALVGLPLRVALPAVVAAEVGAKLSMAGVACFGRARHEGLGSAFTSASSPALFAGPAVVALPAAVLSWPSPVAAVALGGAAGGGGAVAWWASGLLDGVNGDVFGAANEVGRVVGLHAGVVAWTLS